MPADEQLEKYQKNIESIKESLSLPSVYKPTESYKDLLKQEKDRLKSMPDKIAELEDQIRLLKEEDTEAVKLQEVVIAAAKREVTVAEKALREVRQARREANVTLQDLLKQDLAAIEKNKEPVLVLQQKIQDARTDKEKEPPLSFPMRVLKDTYAREEDSRFSGNIDIEMFEKIKSIIEVNKEKKDADMVELTPKALDNISKILARQESIIREKLRKEEEKAKQEKAKQEQSLTPVSVPSEEESCKKTLEQKKANLYEQYERMKNLPSVVLNRELARCKKNYEDYQRTKKNKKLNTAVTTAKAREVKIQAKQKLHKVVKESVKIQIKTLLNASSTSTIDVSKQLKILDSHAAALESITEYCLAQLEQAEPSVQEELRKKCLEKQWALTETGELTYHTAAKTFKMSDILALTYYAYLDTAFQEKNARFPDELREEWRKYKTSLAPADKPSKSTIVAKAPATTVEESPSKTDPEVDIPSAQDNKNEALEDENDISTSAENKTQEKESEQETPSESLNNADAQQPGLDSSVAVTKPDSASKPKKPRKLPREKNSELPKSTTAAEASVTKVEELSSKTEPEVNTYSAQNTKNETQEKEMEQGTLSESPSNADEKPGLSSIVATTKPDKPRKLPREKKQASETIPVQRPVDERPKPESSKSEHPADEAESTEKIENISEILNDSETQEQETEKENHSESPEKIDTQTEANSNSVETKTDEPQPIKSNETAQTKKQALASNITDTNIPQKLTSQLKHQPVDKPPKSEPMKPAPMNFSQKVSHFENLGKEPDALVVKKVPGITENKPLEPPQQRAAPPLFLSKTANHVGSGHLEAAAVKGNITDVNGIKDPAWITIKQKIALAAKAHKDGFVDKKDHVELTTAEKKATIDIARKDTEVTISSRNQNVEIEALVRNYKITADVLGKTECGIHASPSPSYTAKLILALHGSPDPTIIPIMKPSLEAALKESAAQSPPDHEIKRAFDLYEQLKRERADQRAAAKAAATPKPAGSA